MLLFCSKSFLALTMAVFACGCHVAGRHGTMHGSEQVPVDFELELDGNVDRLAKWRGRPLLLVLILTSDVTSQLYMPHVEEAFRHYGGNLRFLALTVEPQERPFLEVYARSEGLHFPLGAAALEVREGQTALGQIPLIPATYILDEHGIVKDVGLGLITSPDIGKALKRALGGEYGN
jgi:hypothetical protein